MTWKRKLRSALIRPCCCGYRHASDCPLRSKSRSKRKAGARFTSLQELYDWLRTKPSIWDNGCVGSSAIPCAFVLGQSYRTVMNRYHGGMYRKVEVI